jgi:recombination protein RecA
MVKDDKLAAADAALKKLEKKAPGVVIDLQDSTINHEIEWLPTGSLALDSIIGKGLPRGRVIEMFGPEGGGKSTIALLAIKEALKEGGIAGYIDAEGAFSKEWAQRIGVDVNSPRFKLVQPDYGEQALDTLDDFLRTEAFDIIVVDSVAALVPKKELEGSMEDNTIGLQARMLGQALRKTTMIARKTKTVVIFINQVRQLIGVLYGNPETTPGGKSLKFWASVRARVSRGKASDDRKNDVGHTIGHEVSISIPKNKVAPPYMKTTFTLMYDEGPRNIDALIALAIENKLITQSGPSYKILIEETEHKFFGAEKLKEALKTDEALLNHLLGKLTLDPIYVRLLKEEK